MRYYRIEDIQVGMYCISTFNLKDFHNETGLSDRSKDDIFKIIHIYPRQNTIHFITYFDLCNNNLDHTEKLNLDYFLSELIDGEFTILSEKELLAMHL